MDPFFIILAVILFIEFAKANEIDVSSPVKCSPELVGHQSFFLYSLNGTSIQYSDVWDTVTWIYNTRF